MMTDQNVFIPRSGGPHDNFLYSSAQIKAVLKAKRVWHLLLADDAASLSSSHEVLGSDEGSDLASAPEYARDIAFSIILQKIGKAPFVWAMRYQKDSQEMWRLLHDRHSAPTTFSRVTGHRSFSSMMYTDQPVH